MERTVAKFLIDEDLHLTADVVGGGGRGTVMLAHGGGQTRHSWASTADRLAAKGWRAVSLDLRGHGDSAWASDGDYHLERFAEDLIAVAENLPEQPHLIGASLGGLAGMMVEALLAPGTFRTLTLVDIVPRSDPEGVEKIMAFMHADLENGFESLEAAADSIAAYMPHRPRPKDLSGLGKNLRLGEDGRYRWHWDPRFVTEMRGDRTQLPMGEFETLCRHIAIPVHLVRGRMSELVSLEAARAFVADLPDATFTDVADAGHMVAGDRNDAFLEAAVAFLEAQPPSIADVQSI